ncbi:MAG: 30S ribosomal protein S21 [Candidatus Omnitrophica bacterium]|nr:30S ribosomal protein S21 [Candidatus Omnitrophota bacterium]
MAKVIIHRKEDFERAFKQFKMRCKREGILKEYREKQHYTKPSEKKRRAMKKKK